MTEGEAIAWLDDVPRETRKRLRDFVEMLKAESQHQNLIAASTLPHIWNRHVVDSAQLLRLAPDAGSWLDIGSGAGFPGLIIAAIGRRPISLVEPRFLRAQFLGRAAEILDVADLIELFSQRVQTMRLGTYGIISARAFASLPALFDAAYQLADQETLWLLPKGRNAASELEAVRAKWQGEFRTEPSITDPESAIIVARGVKPRGRR